MHLLGWGVGIAALETKKTWLLPLGSWLSHEQVRQNQKLQSSLWSSGLVSATAHPPCLPNGVNTSKISSCLPPIAIPSLEGGHSSLPVAQVTNPRCALDALFFSRQTTNKFHENILSKYIQNLPIAHNLLLFGLPISTLSHGQSGQVCPWLETLRAPISE